VASTQATIDLIVRGSAAVNRLISDVSQLQGAVQRINSQTLDLAPREANSSQLRGTFARINEELETRTKLTASLRAEQDRLVAAERNQGRQLRAADRIERIIAGRRERGELASRQIQEMENRLIRSAKAAERFNGEIGKISGSINNLQQDIGGVQRKISETSREVSKTAGGFIDANQLLASANAVRALAREYTSFGDSLKRTKDEVTLTTTGVPDQIKDFRRLGDEITRVEQSLEGLRRELAGLGQVEAIVDIPRPRPRALQEGELLAGLPDMLAQQRAAQTQQENALRQQRNQRRTEIAQQIQQEENLLRELEMQTAASGMEAIARQERLGQMVASRTPEKNPRVGLGVSLNQIQSQAEALALVANNSEIASNEFVRYTIAAEIASIKLARSQQATFAALAGGFSEAMDIPAGLGGFAPGGGGAREVSGARAQVSELINMIPELTRSEAALGAHISLLTKVQQLLPFVSLEYRAVEDAIRGLNEELQDAAAMKNAPATRLGSLEQYRQQEAFRSSAEKTQQRRQKESNNILDKYSKIYSDIYDAQIGQVDKTRLLENSSRVLEALDEDRLESAKAITRELQDQLDAAKGRSKAEREAARRGGPSMPVTGRLVTGGAVPGSPAAQRQGRRGPALPVSGRLIGGGFAPGSPEAKLQETMNQARLKNIIRSGEIAEKSLIKLQAQDPSELLNKELANLQGKLAEAQETLNKAKQEGVSIRKVDVDLLGYEIAATSKLVQLEKKDGGTAAATAKKAKDGPSVAIDNLVEQRKYQRQINDAYKEQEDIIDKINKAGLSQNQVEKLSIGIGQAREALLGNQLEESQQITREVEKQLQLEREIENNRQKQRAKGVNWTTFLARGEEAIAENRDKAAAVSKKEAEDAANARKNQLTKLETQLNNYTILEGKGVKFMEEKAELAKLVTGLSNNQVALTKQETEAIDELIKKFRLYSELRVSQAKTAGTYKSGPSGKTQAEINEDRRGRLFDRARAQEDRLLRLSRKGIDVADLRKGLEEQILNIQKLQGNATADNVREAAEALMPYKRAIDDLANSLSKSSKSGPGLEQALQKLREARGSREAFLAGASPAVAIDKIVREFNSGGQNADDAGKNIAETFANSLEAGAPAAAAAAKKMAKSSTDAINKEFGINSPSRFMIELVQNLVKTYANQLYLATPTIQEAARKAFSIDEETLKGFSGKAIDEKTSQSLLDASAKAGAALLSEGSQRGVSAQEMAGYIAQKGAILDPAKLQEFLGEKFFKAAEGQLSTGNAGAELKVVQDIYKDFYGIGREAEKAVFSAQEIELAIKNLTSGLDIIATLVQASADLTKKIGSGKAGKGMLVPLSETDPSIMAGQAKAFGQSGLAGMTETEWSDLFKRLGGVPDFNKLFTQQEFYKIKNQKADPELQDRFKSIFEAETTYTTGSRAKAPRLVDIRQPNIFSTFVEQARAAASAAIPKTAQEQIPAAYGTSPERMARLYGNARGQGAGRFGISEEQWLAGFKKIGMVPDFEKMFGKEQWSLVEQGNEMPEIESKIKSIILGAASKAAKEIAAGSSSLTTIPGQAQIAGAGGIVAQDDKQRQRIEEAYRRSAERQAAIMAEDTAMRIAGKSLMPAPAAQPAQAAQQIQEKTAISAEVKKAIDSVFTDIGIAAKNGVKKIQESKVGQAIDSISSNIGAAADKASQKIKKTEAGKAFDFVADKTKKGADAAAAKIKQIKAKEAFDFIANKVDQGADAFLAKIKGTKAEKAFDFLFAQIDRAIDKAQSAASGIGGGFGAGGGTRPPSGGGPGGPGGPGGQKDPEEFARRLDEATKKGAEALLGLEELRDPTKASINEIEALSAVLKEFRAVLDPTAKGFDRLDDQLRETIAKIDREGQVRAPDAGFLTRFTRDPRKANAISEGLIGGAFPLLFGQGLGASVGGGLGGFAGGFAGGGLGFGLSLIGTALGTAFDTAVQSAKELGAALQKPVENFDKLAEKSFFSSRGQEELIKKTIQSGNASFASALIQQEAIKKVGVNGVKNLKYLETQSDKLGRSFAEVGVGIQAFIAGPLGSLLDALNAYALEPAVVANRLKAVRGGLSSEQQKILDREIARAGGLAESSRLPSEKVPAGLFDNELNVFIDTISRIKPEKVKEIIDRFESAALANVRTTPKEAIETQINVKNKELELRDIGKNVIDQARNAAREQQDLDKQRFEIIESYEESIRQIRKQIEDEVANRRFAILEKENSLLDLQAENRIKEFERFTKTSIEKAGAGKPKEIEDIAKRTAEIVSTFLTEQISAEEKAAKIKRDAALEAKRLDFEALNFKVEVEKQVSKLNVDTAKQVKQINEQTQRRNEEYSSNKFKLERRIAELELAAVKIDVNREIAALKELLKTARPGDKSYFEQQLKLQYIQQKIVSEGIAEIKNLKPPANLGAIAPVGGGAISTAGIDSLVKTQSDQIARQTAEALRSVEFAYANSAETLASEIEKISAEILTPLADLGVAIPLENAKALPVSNKITENEQRRARYSQLINQGYKESIANKIIELEFAGKLATAQYDAAIQQLRSQEYYDEALKTQRAILDDRIKALRIERGLTETTETRKKQIDGTIAGITRYSAELGTVIRTSLDSQAVLLEKAKAGIPGAIQSFAPQLIQKERRNEIEDFVNQGISSLNDLEATAIRVSQGIGNAVGNSFEQLVTGLLDGTATGQEVFAGFLKSVAEILAKEAVSIIATYTAIGIARIFAGLSGGGSTFFDASATPIQSTNWGGSGGGLFGNLGTDWSQAPSIGGVQGFANGAAFTNSIVSSPTLFKFADGASMETGLMGEAGPEAIMPLTRGPGGRLGVDASGAGGGSIMVNVSVDASGSKVQGDEAQGAQLGRVIGAAVQQELIKQKRPGGLLA
jgi:hypothetical protein